MVTFNLQQGFLDVALFMMLRAVWFALGGIRYRWTEARWNRRRERERLQFLEGQEREREASAEKAAQRAKRRVKKSTKRGRGF
jgi:hypothetical protein